VDPLRVFISSTSADLAEYRQAAHDAIMGIELLPVDMIYWSADPRSGSAASVDRVKQSDVLILIVAHRYGHVPKWSRYSVTEQEYRAARAAGIPVLAFFLDRSVPWPPDQVEWDARDKLDAFRALVESEVTRKLFRRPDDLATQIVQALALLDRSPRRRRPSRFSGPGVREVALPTALRTDPDVLVPIGTAEDGLPLVLDVQRARDLSGPVDALAAAVDSPGRPAPTALFDTFRQALEEHADQTWAAERVHPVTTDGQGGTEELYVSSFTLTRPFTSILAALTRGQVTGRFAQPGPHSYGARYSVPLVAHTAASPLAGDPVPLASSGGSNRFLAVSPQDGRTYSVGRLRDGRLTVWRPFVCESALAAFPSAVLTARYAGRQVSAALPEAPELLMAHLHDQSRDRVGRLPVEVEVEVGTGEVVSVVVEIARRLADLHGTGRAHGDVKPHNILLTTDGVVLIDSFDVQLDHPSPGWTPDWSAPEQVLGLPVTPTADLYPLAVLLGGLLGGELVGEVRTYAMPSTGRGARDYRVFHNPALQLDPDRAGMPADAVRAWRTLVERGVRFDQDQRPASLADFADEVEALAAECPIPGRRSFRPTGDLLAARLTDGRDAVVRAVFDPPESAYGHRPQIVPTYSGYGYSYPTGAPPPPEPSTVTRW
jgi:hypothetical protein